jgi:hypothetical protein
MGFWDKLGDFADGISGKTDSDNLQAQLQQQRDLNEKIIALQQQEIKYKESPEYLAARQKRIYAACIVLLFAIGGAFYILNKRQ